MAKVKTYAIDIEVVVKRTLYIEARRPNGARDRLLTPEGWREATAYQEGDALPISPDDSITVTRIREAGF